MNTYSRELRFINNHKIMSKVTSLLHIIHQGFRLDMLGFRLGISYWYSIPLFEDSLHGTW